MTHPRPADAFDLYRTASWDARCEAVQKLHSELREGRLIPLPARHVALSVMNGGGAVEAEAVQPEA